MSFLSDSNKAVLSVSGLDTYATIVGQYMAFKCNGDILFEYLEGELGASFTRKEKKTLIKNLNTTCKLIVSVIRNPPMDVER